MTGGIDRPELEVEELRVLGCLIEKELTTPQQYPLTLNALVLACNQSSNRDPVVSYDEATVELAVRTLKQKGLARFVHPTHGRSVLRYQHVMPEALGVDRPQLAILAVLLLRGPQTVGEIRTRCERMAEFDNLEHVSHELDLLTEHAGGLVAPVPRRPGQKEGRFVHLLGSGAWMNGAEEDQLTRHGEMAAERGGMRLALDSLDSLDDSDGRARGATMGERLEALTREVADLRRDLDALRSELGVSPAPAPPPPPPPLVDSTAPTAPAAAIDSTAPALPGTPDDGITENAGYR